MDVNETMNRLDLQSEIVAFAIIAIALLLILYLNRQRMSVGFQEWRIQRCLNQIGTEQIRDLICPDGLEGHYTIDRIALTRDAILVIAYKPYVGNIYCAERIAEWTQVIGQKSFKFENPLFDLENQITALTLAFGSIPLKGYLFFSHSAIFPKGHPESVLQPENIPPHLMRDHHQAVKEDVRAAWDHLKWQQANLRGVSEARRVKT
jgi:hypothetical protein